MMKQRIPMLMFVLFVATFVIPISDVKAATSDDMSISASQNTQDMSNCNVAKEGCDKAKECEKAKECNKDKDGCDTPKVGCDKSATKKAGCSK